MKVLYDISVLGSGHVIQGYRTGVFRVIENVAEQLANHADLKLKFFSNTDRNTLSYSLDYLKSTPAVSRIPFSKPPFYDHLLEIGSLKAKYIDMIVSKQPIAPVKKMQMKLQIKKYLLTERLCQGYKDDLFNKKDLAKADIYHSPFYAIPGSISIKSEPKVFLTCYDLISILFPQYFEQDLNNMVKQIIDSITYETWVLCISHATRNDLLNYLGKKVNPDRVIVTELAASDNFYQSNDTEQNLQIRRKHNIPDAPYVLSLCTFEPRKNIDQVIRAFVKMITEEKINDLYLVLVGNKGWLFDKIFEELANSAEVKSRIIITGFVKDEDLAALYSDALLFVYPSFYEGFGLPPLEAMKCGTPVITSNTSSLPEVVGNAGIMVNPKDTDELCNAMLSVYKSPALQAEMSANSLERSGHFSWERCGEETVKAYRSSLAV